MKSIIIFILLFSNIPVRIVETTAWVDSLTKYIISHREINEVNLITNYGNSRSRMSDLLGEIYKKLAVDVRILRTDVNFDDKPLKLASKDKKNDDDFESDDGMATQGSLFLLFHDALTGILPSATMIEYLSNTSAFHYRPLFLVILVLPEWENSLELFLKLTWTKKLLDVTIAETTKLNETRTADFTAENTLMLPIIHQYDPFSNNYTRERWSESIEWFPDKLRNMHGYPLKIGVVNMPPFSGVTLDAVGIPVNVSGTNIVVIRAIAQTLNFGLHYVPGSSLIGDSVDPSTIYDLMSSGKIDLMSYLSPHYTESYADQNIRTTAILYEKLCPLVPSVPQVRMKASTELTASLSLCVAIVFIYWTFTRIPSFYNRSFRLFNIIGIVFGVSVTSTPERSSQRVLFVNLFILSAIYSVSLYQNLMELSFETDVDADFQTFEDLDYSGLKPIINEMIVNKTFGVSDGGVLKMLKDKTEKYPNYVVPQLCRKLAGEYKNVTCLTTTYEAKAMIMQNRRDRIGHMKIVNPCFWSDSTSFLIARGSPYRFKIDSVIMNLHSTGLFEQWYGDLSADRKLSISVGENMTIVKALLINLIYFGAILGGTAFLIEIIVFNVRRYIKNRKK